MKKSLICVLLTMVLVIVTAGFAFAAQEVAKALTEKNVEITSTSKT